RRGYRRRLDLPGAAAGLARGHGVLVRYEHVRLGLVAGALRRLPQLRRRGLGPRPAPRLAERLPAERPAAGTRRAGLGRVGGGEPTDPSDPGVGACGPAGVNEWCNASIDGAWFNAAWQSLATWRPELLTFTSPPQSLTAGVASAPLAIQLQTSTGEALTASSPL